MRIKAVHTYLPSTAKLSGQTTYEETAGLVLPERAADTSATAAASMSATAASTRATAQRSQPAWRAKAGCAAGEAHAPVAPRVAQTVVTDLLAPIIVGQDARHIAPLWEQMFSLCACALTRRALRPKPLPGWISPCGICSVTIAKSPYGCSGRRV